jgi:hypothetical protein
VGICSQRISIPVCYGDDCTTVFECTRYALANPASSTGYQHSLVGKSSHDHPAPRNENFGAGVLDRLGLGYDAMQEINPGLVCCALKGFLSGHE